MTTQQHEALAELMVQIDRYGRRLCVDDLDTLRTIRAGIETKIHTLTDRIAELEAQLDAVGAGGVSAAQPPDRHALQAQGKHPAPCAQP